MMMKKDHLVAAILFFVIFSFSVSVKGLSEQYYLKCLSDFDHTIKKCVLLNFDAFVSLKGQKVHINSACCGAIREFDEACASESLVFESEALFIRWLVDSCGRDNQQAPPTPSSSSSSSPPIPPTPTTPVSGNQSSPHFVPPPMELPEIIVSRGPSCWSSSSAIAHFWKELNDTCCLLSRFKGIHCETGEPYDRVQEKCCVNCSFENPQRKWFQVTPRYVGTLG
jgi:hypothetical protein